MLALAGALQRSGHSATVAGPPNFAVPADALGITFAPMGQDAQAFVTQLGDTMFTGPVTVIRNVRAFLREEVRAHFKVLRERSDDADVMVGAGLMFAGPSVAQALNLPYRHVAYAPEAVPSAFLAPLTVPWQGLPRFLNRFAWRLTDFALNIMLLRPINDERRTLGLPSIRSTLADFAPIRDFLFAFDPELAQLPLDIAPRTPPTGAWHLADPRPLDESLERFIASGEPPIYIGFGSMPDSHAAQTTRTILEAVTRAGCRAVVCAGWAGLGGDETTHERVSFVPSAPHDKLFPRMAAIVHHGGAGTTAAAARAGVAQVIVPHAFDQFAWAARVARLGVGPAPLEKRKFGVDALVSRITDCLSSPSLRARAAEIGALVRSRDGLANAVAALVEVREPRRPSDFAQRNRI
jgi:vancomycin aglycone glucosyltransferase